MDEKTQCKSFFIFIGSLSPAMAMGAMFYISDFYNIPTQEIGLGLVWVMAVYIALIIYLLYVLVDYAMYEENSSSIASYRSGGSN